MAFPTKKTMPSSNSYKALGGDIRVIVENKGHSHGMKDPTPVLKFIRKHTRSTLEESGTKQPENAWVIDNDADWVLAASDQTNLHIADGMATPTAKEATYLSRLKTFDKPRSLKSITLDQSPVWHNWEPINNLGPSNLGDAPVMVTVGPDNYWMFGRYGGKGKKGFKAENAKLEGFDIPLKTTPFPNQYDAPGGLKPGKGGYHAWQSRDMVNWVHHGSVTEGFSSWVTTAEYTDGKLYIYYDYPNDQDRTSTSMTTSPMASPAKTWAWPLKIPPTGPTVPSSVISTATSTSSTKTGARLMRVNIPGIHPWLAMPSVKTVSETSRF